MDLEGNVWWDGYSVCINDSCRRNCPKLDRERVNTGKVCSGKGKHGNTVNIVIMYEVL